uniref:Peroxisomal ATPase PEX6 n=1 Tax=Lepisosteus oculatus TaxID=7918 RepID=W5NEY3_LEPOC|nr:PREDICTED: peroxisome biogenesis factor 6 isoform X1 [Lepisosteus oculatus]
MAAQAELFCLDTFPSHYNQLHVLLAKSQFNQIFPGRNELPCVLLCARRRQSPPRADMFLCAHVTTEEDIPEFATFVNSDTLLKLYTSRLFFRHYGFQPGAKVSVRLASPIGLSKIVVGAKSRQSFKWANSDKFSNGLLILASCQKQNVLARQGDVLLVPYHPLFGDDIAQVNQYFLDLVVLECTPVTQGVITVNTTVVVTDCRDLAQNHGPLEGSSQASTTRLLTSLYASDFAHYANSFSGGRSLLEKKKVIKSDFSDFLQALECRFDVRVMDVSSLLKQGRIKIKDKADLGTNVDASIFVSKHSLLKLGLFNHEWVVVSTLSLSSDKMRVSVRSDCPEKPEDHACSKDAVTHRGGHLAAVVVAEFTRSQDLEFHENVGFVSPSLWFNLSGGAPMPIASRVVKIKRCYEQVSQQERQLKDSRSSTASLPFARELHIDAIISPDYSSKGSIDSVLYAHFSTPRLVQLGDVLSIPTEGHAAFLESHTEGFTSWPVLYFRVKKVCGTTTENGEMSPFGYLADTEHTSLYLAGNINSFVPCSPGGDGPSFWTSLCPPGLSHTVEQIVSTIQPHVTEGAAVLGSACTLLVHGPCGSGKVTTVRAACARLNLHFLKVDCVGLCGETAAAGEAKLQGAFSRAELHQPCALLLRNVQWVGKQREGSAEDARAGRALRRLIAGLAAPASGNIVVIGTVRSPRELSLDVMMAFVHQVAVESPTEEQRKAMLTSLSAGQPLGKDVNLGKIAKQTAGFLLGDLCTLLGCAGKSAYRRILKTCFPGGLSLHEEEDLRASGVCILAEDFASALDELQKAHSRSVGAPKIPSVKWQDIGGLQHVKREILDTIQLPLEHPELVSLGLRRSGVLLYGPPGTGKTLLAKAVATECSLTFLSVKGPELINMYVGQSEENVREVFSKARAAAPCVVFFDELDSLAPNRGRSGDSGGVMDRVVSQLLAELDGLHSSGDVFVIGATNRPDLLDPSLLRPGRFDKLVYVGINEDKESQLQVLKAILRKFKLDPNVSLLDIAERCPPQLTGADLYALCSDAMTSAIKRKISRIDEGLDTENSDLLLTLEDFRHALQNLQPSVSDQELLKYKLIQQKFTAK